MVSASVSLKTVWPDVRNVLPLRRSGLPVPSVKFCTRVA
jgi:hypothetical protein